MAPEKPGIYVVSLRSAERVPVTQDRRYRDNCALVNCMNVKFGKAASLARREQDYWKDFGRENVSFLPIAITEEIGAAEAAVLRALREYRKPSPKGGRMDWMQGISANAIVDCAQKVLAEARISHELFSAHEF